MFVPFFIQSLLSLEFHLFSPFGLFQSIHPETVMFFFSSRGRIMLPTIFQIKFLLLCDIFSFKNFQTDTTSRKNHQNMRTSTVQERQLTCI